MINQIPPTLYRHGGMVRGGGYFPPPSYFTEYKYIVQYKLLGSWIHHILLLLLHLATSWHELYLRPCYCSYKSYPTAEPL